jgi:hypothetical protein
MFSRPRNSIQKGGIMYRIIDDQGNPIHYGTFLTELDAFDYLINFLGEDSIINKFKVEAV